MDYQSLSDGRKTSTDDLMTKWFPRISLIVGLCAFIFQVVVLYPWHLELSAEFAKLAAAVKNATK
jgi:hypothetical protein